MTELKNGAITIQRAAVLDTLRGLALTGLRQSYDRGEYQKGFADALLCASVIFGVDEEFLKDNEKVLSRINAPR